jgi:hypothetical protein
MSILPGLPSVPTSVPTILPSLPPVPTNVPPVLPGLLTIPTSVAPVPNINKHSYRTNKEPKNTSYKTIYSIFHSIIAFFAIYLSFKCNNGFSFGGFIMAIFFPYIYIIYKAAMNNLCFGNNKVNVN